MSLRLNIRGMERRLAKLEKARVPRPSPFVIICGSFDEFADTAYTEVIAGKLDRQFLHILDHLREWNEQGVWVLAYAR